MDPVIIKTIADLGIIGVCLFVIVLGWKREERSATAFAELNKASHEIQTETVKQMTELTSATRILHQEIRQRPCVDAQHYDGNERRKGH